LPSPLTRREIEVLKMVAQGATNKEISSDLKISEHTVKSHVVPYLQQTGGQRPNPGIGLGSLSRSSLTGQSLTSLLKRRLLNFLISMLSKVIDVS
jgi:FixJ family two-component response regulator